jgi:hypothetical protein
LKVFGLGNWDWEAGLSEGEGDSESESGSDVCGLKAEKLVSEEGVVVECEFISSPKRSSE